MPRQMPTTPGPRIRAQARGRSLLLTFPIGGRGSRHRRPLPDRLPTLQAFRSVLSETRHSPLARLSPRPFGLGPQSKAFRRLPIGCNPTAFKAPVRTSVATEFNSGEHGYDTIPTRHPSIRALGNFMLNRKTPLAVLIALRSVGDADVDPRRSTPPSR